ncbi:MAG: flavodoxin [Nocardioides sp.]|nr:flavodoxin [Nocardioides sp.]
MRILIAYASKHGGTEGIAVRLGSTLTDLGHEVDVHGVEAAGVGGYDAFVIGSAQYMAHWRKEATAFVEKHRDAIAGHPVWLFSSGPLGTDDVDDQGRDLRTLSRPQELPDLEAAVHPREHHVFFGRIDPHTLTLAERALRRLPAGRQLLPEGDFRDWDEIDEWARTIDGQLANA